MSAVVGFCPNCNRSVLVEVREWHIYDDELGRVLSYIPHLLAENCCVYADCPHCGGDIDQYEGAT